MSDEENAQTTPASPDSDHTAPKLVVEPTYTAPDGSVYVHRDLLKVVEPWATEQHIGPAVAHERFGDIESFVGYITRFQTGEVPDSGPFITWNERGIKAVLDYHEHTGNDGAGRCQWVAEYPFVFAPEWAAWAGIANGRSVTQRELVEFIEEHRADVTIPNSADLLDLLRNLRGNVQATAQAELRPNGTTDISFAQTKTVEGVAKKVEVPSQINVGLPVLKGHVSDEGRPVRYQLDVPLRVNISDDGKLAFHLHISNVERILEDVFGERVSQARELLGDGWAVWRATV